MLQTKKSRISFFKLRLETLNYTHTQPSNTISQVILINI